MHVTMYHSKHTGRGTHVTVYHSKHTGRDMHVVHSSQELVPSLPYTTVLDMYSQAGNFVKSYMSICYYDLEQVLCGSYVDFKYGRMSSDFRVDTEWR